MRYSLIIKPIYTGPECLNVAAIIAEMFRKHIKFRGGEFETVEEKENLYSYKTNVDLTKETGYHRVVRKSPLFPDDKLHRSEISVECFEKGREEKLEHRKMYNLDIGYIDWAGKISWRADEILNGDFSSLL